MEGLTWVAGVDRLGPPALDWRVRDDKMRVWVMADGCVLQTEDGRHTEHWDVLHGTTDLVLIG